MAQARSKHFRQILFAVLLLSGLALSIGTGRLVWPFVTALAAKDAPETVEMTSAAPKAPPVELNPLFPVRSGGRMGFIDGQGRIVIEPTFEKVYAFSEGLAAAQVNGRWGYIDQQGQMVIQPRFAMAGFFHEGLADARLEFDQPYGYIDTRGAWVIEPRFDTAGPFNGGCARVGFQTLASRLRTRIADVGLDCNYRFIDRTGEYLNSPAATADSALRWDKDKCGYVDASDQVIIATRVESALPFVEGLGPVKVKGKWGYLDASGQMVIPAIYDSSLPFSEGMGGVKLNGLWGYVDRDGQVVIAPQFHWVHGFKNGLSEVTLNKKSGYIDRHGKYVWEPR